MLKSPLRRTIAATLLALGLIGGGTALASLAGPDQCTGATGEAQQDCRLDRLEVTVYGTATPSPSPTDTPTPTVSTTPTPTPTDTPTPSPTPTPASTAVLGASLGQPLPVAQTLPAVRYYSPGSTWGGTLAQQYVKGTRTFVISTKDSDTAAFAHYLTTAPTDATYYVTYYHEPDDNIADGSLSPAAWCSGMNALGHAVAGMADVKLGPIHNGWLGADTWKANERTCDTSLWGYWGADRYSHNYEAPVTQFAGIDAYAQSLGLPLVIGETGSDTTDATAQAAFAGQVHAYALDPANRVAVICWWNQGRDLMANATVQHAFFG